MLGEEIKIELIKTHLFMRVVYLNYAIKRYHFLSYQICW